MKKSLAIILLLSFLLNLARAVTVTPHFVAADAGNYTGLFTPTNNPSVQNAGLLLLTMGGSGICSGKVFCQGAVYSILPGKLDASGRLRTHTVLPLCDIDVQLDLVGGKTITGNVSGSDWLASVQCHRSMFNAQHPTPLAGRYNFILSDGSSSADAPLGKAFLAMTVANNGNVTFSGALADNTLITHPLPTCIGETGAWPMYASEQKTNGQGQVYAETVMGWLQLTANVGSEVVVTGDILWMSADPTNQFSSTLQAVGGSYSVTSPPAFWPAREKVHIYLLMGQSNMAGHGRITAVDKVPNLRVISFGADNYWQPAVEPLHKNHGVGPGLAFGKIMADNDPSVVIALIPAAVDSTSLNHWTRGTKLYGIAITRAILAMKWGTFKGFLWHQGENDALSPAALTYKERLAPMIADIRQDLGVTNAPFVVGEIGHFIYHRPEFPWAAAVNKQLDAVPSLVPLTGCVMSDGLTPISDGIHFDAPSQRIMGRGYAELMSALQTQAGE